VASACSQSQSPSLVIHLSHQDGGRWASGPPEIDFCAAAASDAGPEDCINAADGGYLAHVLLDRDRASLAVRVHDLTRVIDLFFMVSLDQPCWGWTVNLDVVHSLSITLPSGDGPLIVDPPGAGVARPCP
jgi:hypothetical protein